MVRNTDLFGHAIYILALLVSVIIAGWKHFAPTIEVFSAGRDNIWID
ncbi:MAG: hypothetical protein OXL40_05170 [Bacteroidota bacterium]|nr:hypothetical protein [Bacteroidota bacterium]